MLGKAWGAGIVIRDLVSTLSTTREGRREGGREGERKELCEGRNPYTSAIMDVLYLFTVSSLSIITSPHATHLEEEYLRRCTCMCVHVVCKCTHMGMNAHTCG